MKAGLIEIADVMVVNKADREGADRAAAAADGRAVDARARPRQVPVLKTTATTGEGVAALVGADRERRRAAPPRARRERRRRRARYLIARAAADLIAERIKSDAAGALDGLADEVLSGRLLPADAARKLIR